MEEKITIGILLDAPIDKWRDKLICNLTRDELLQLWRDFRKWILVHAWEYLLNKRHIIGIEMPNRTWRDNKSRRNYLNKVMELEEWWNLLPNE